MLSRASMTPVSLLPKGRAPSLWALASVCQMMVRRNRWGDELRSREWYGRGWLTCP